jgi:predicted Rossmann-fold nucleotide-binding protein
LAEILTLVQTGKTRRIPIILVHKPFWEGLIVWFNTSLVEEGIIDESDLKLIQMLDKPREVVDAIFKYYENRGFETSPEEREMLLDL